MKRIGITQRIELVADYGEKRVCLDQNWGRLLLTAGLLPLPLFNLESNMQTYFETLHLDGLILSGGNDIATITGAVNPAPERDLFESRLLQHCSNEKLPVIGVCRGAQLLNQYCGGEVVSVQGHVRTRHQINWSDRSDYKYIDREVNSYHNYGITSQSLGDQLRVLAKTIDDTIEAFVHESLPWLGIMWHPEREPMFSSQDMKIFKDIFG